MLILTYRQICTQIKGRTHRHIHIHVHTNIYTNIHTHISDKNKYANRQTYTHIFRLENWPKMSRRKTCFPIRDLWTQNFFGPINYCSSLIDFTGTNFFKKYFDPKFSRLKICFVEILLVEIFFDRFFCSITFLVKNFIVEYFSFRKLFGRKFSGLTFIGRKFHFTSKIVFGR